jgi:Zn finger protein HypA/HybF involved in hydrogenase expression
MVENNEPKSAICRILHCKSETLENYLKKMNITYNGNMSMKGKKTDKNRKTAIEYSKKNIVVSAKLRLKLIEDGLKKEECEQCGISEWMNQKIPLELHHIDGNRFNNNLDNLQILCPNCHSLTPNHSGKKFSKIREKNKTKFVKYCECGKEIQKRSVSCVDCAKKKNRKVIRPSYEKLIDDVNKFGYSKVGLFYNVSSNTIKSWILQYEKCL